LKLPNKAASAVSTPEPEPAPVDDAPVDEVPAEDTPAPSDDKPFDDTPFDAGVEADEEENPKKFIEQLAGKIATTLRSYTKDEGEPDLELEKYVINSVIAATHTSEMDEEDRNDIVKKINDAGEDDKEPEEEEAPVDEVPAEDEAPVEDEEPIDEADVNMWGQDKTFNDTSKAMWEEEEMEESNHFEMNELLGEGGDEEGSATRYMFFSNLEQMRRQAGLLLDLDEGQIEAILNSGHDWAADHIATAKESFDQVFDFLMNETNDDEDDYSEWSKPMELQKDIQISEGLRYHLDNKIPLGESVYRYGSDKFFLLLKEVKFLYSKDLIKLNENDIFIVNDFDSKIRLNGEVIQLGRIIESEEESEILNEAEYQGKKVEIGKPKRGGSKKFYVYVKNPKTGKVKKVSFGAKSGGGNLAVKLKDPKARKAFADRHNCEQKNDKTTPGYWSCRLPRYAKLLGLSGGGRFW